MYCGSFNCCSMSSGLETPPLQMPASSRSFFITRRPQFVSVFIVTAKMVILFIGETLFVKLLWMTGCHSSWGTGNSTCSSMMFLPLFPFLRLTLYNNAVYPETGEEILCWCSLTQKHKKHCQLKCSTESSQDRPLANKDVRGALCRSMWIHP